MEESDVSWVAIGRFVGAFGVRGEAHVQVLMEDPQEIFSFSKWWVGPEKGQKRQFDVVSGHVHGSRGGGVVVKLEHVNDRDASRHLSGQEIWIPRSELPVAGDNLFYWSDLIGLRVVDEQQVVIGTVDHLFATGANDVISVRGVNGDERLIPFIPEVVLAVDVEAKTVTVRLMAGM